MTAGLLTSASSVALLTRLPVDGRYFWDHDRPDSIGRVHGFNGNFGVLVRAFAYVFAHGRDGLREVGERAVLNANYLAAAVSSAYPLAYPGRPMHEFVSTAKRLRRHGVRAMDVAKRLIDLGFHPSTDSSTRISEMGLAATPRDAICSSCSASRAIPVPPPPSTNDGRTITG